MPQRPPAKVYISSTYEDLKEYREAALRACRRLGYHVLGMEEFVAGDERPADKTLGEIAAADVYIGIIGWRYGHVLQGANLSITHLEYREAVKRGLTSLIFMAAEEASWPVQFIDSSKEIQQFRGELKRDRLVSYFSNPSDLETRVTAALAVLEREGRFAAPRREPLDAFLSYNAADREPVTALAHRLRQDGLNIWMSDVSLNPGDEWLSEAEDALGRANVAVVFIGSQGVGSWQIQEVRGALDRRAQDPDFRVIPVLLPGAEPKQVPDLLKPYTWIAFRSLDDPDAYSRLLSIRPHVAPVPAEPHLPDQPLEDADLQLLVELLFRVVVRNREHPEMLNSLEPTMVWAAIRKIKPQASNLEDLKSLHRELSGEPGPGPLWKNWMRSTRAAELTSLLGHAGPPGGAAAA